MLLLQSSLSVSCAGLLDDEVVVDGNDDDAIDVEEVGPCQGETFSGA